MESVSKTDASIDVQSRYNGSTTRPSIAIINAIADLEDVEPVELSTMLDTTLYDWIDPEALDTLVTGNGNVSISFTIDKYTVEIDGNTIELGC